MSVNGFHVSSYVQLIIPFVWTFSNLSLVLTKSVGNFYVSKRLITTDIINKTWTAQSGNVQNKELLSMNVMALINQTQIKTKEARLNVTVCLYLSPNNRARSLSTLMVVVDIRGWILGVLKQRQENVPPDCCDVIHINFPK